jgi:hypothetical protein
MSKRESLRTFGARLIRVIFLSWSFGANGLSRRLDLGLFFWTPWAIFEVALIFMALYYHLSICHKFISKVSVTPRAEKRLIKD